MSALAVEPGLTLQFEDAHTFPGNQDFYAVPNEAPERWDQLLQGLRFHNVGGICSGGEVGLFSLLPLAQRKLVLVDHSYKSMYFALVKYLTLAKYGPEEAYKRLTDYPSYVSWEVSEQKKAAFTALAAEFDGVIPAAFHEAWNRGRDYYSHRQQHPAAAYFASRADGVASFWSRQSPGKVIKTCAKLGKIQFVHGDLTDLAKFGRFGLLYLSNALESNHRNRDRTMSIPDKVAACLKPDGYVCTTHSASRYERVKYPENWELVNKASATDRFAGETGWTYNLFQVHPVPSC